jgi:hypothetical protein
LRRFTENGGIFHMGIDSRLHFTTNLKPFIHLFLHRWKIDNKLIIIQKVLLRFLRKSSIIFLINFIFELMGQLGRYRPSILLQC